MVRRVLFVPSKKGSIPEPDRTRRPDEPPPPNYVEMPFLGTFDPNTNELRSFDSGKQVVGVPPYLTEWFYKFELDASLGQVLSGSIVTGPEYNANIEIQDAAHNTLGPLVGPLPQLGSGTYYIHVTASSSTNFHFGVVAVPPLSQYPNDAGHSQNSPLSLGSLTSTISHSNSFYTYFTREYVSESNSSATGSLLPDFTKPIPSYAPSPDWYQFSLSKAMSVSLSKSVPAPGPSYLLYLPDGRAGTLNSGDPIQLAAGSYLLAVYDQRTWVAAGGGGIVAIRNPHDEDFEHYQFQLVAS